METLGRLSITIRLFYLHRDFSIDNDSEDDINDDAFDIDDDSSLLYSER